MTLWTLRLYGLLLTKYDWITDIVCNFVRNF